MNICVIGNRKYMVEGKSLSVVTINGVTTINGKPLSEYPYEELEPGNGVTITGNGSVVIQHSSSSSSSVSTGSVSVSTGSGSGGGSDFKMPQSFHDAMDKLERDMAKLKRKFQK